MFGSDPKDVSAEANEVVFIGTAGMRLWKVVTFVGYADDRLLVF